MGKKLQFFSFIYRLHKGAKVTIFKVLHSFADDYEHAEDLAYDKHKYYTSLNKGTGIISVQIKEGWTHI